MKILITFHFNVNMFISSIPELLHSLFLPPLDPCFLSRLPDFVTAHKAFSKVAARAFLSRTARKRAVLHEKTTFEKP
jgi:hypothetical protein